MYSDHCAINVETKNKRISGNYKNPWIVNDLQMSNKWVKEAKKEIKKLLEIMKIKAHTPKCLKNIKSILKRTGEF